MKHNYIFLFFLFSSIGNATLSMQREIQNNENQKHYQWYELVDKPFTEIPQKLHETAKNAKKNDAIFNITIGGAFVAVHAYHLYKWYNNPSSFWVYITDPNLPNYILLKGASLGLTSYLLKSGYNKYREVQAYKEKNE